MPAPSTSPSQASGKPGVALNSRRQVEIVTIPEKFYGMALTMNGLTQAERDAAPAPKPVVKPTVIVKPPEKVFPWSFVLVILLLILVTVVVFAYINRDLLFPKPATPVVVIPPPKVPPSAPANLSATTTGSAVSLTWVNGGGDESGIRIERAENGAGYVPVTVLPAASNVFLDVSVQAAHGYVYRVIAFGEGGESSPSNEANVQVPAPVPPPVPVVVAPAPTLPPGALDSDSDGLTDVEEALYGTDLHNPDSDGDGFLDGNEAFHLYNPAAKSPVRLLDSGIVKLFSAPVGWSVLIPASWTGGLDIPDGSQATLASGRGETIVMRIEDNPTGASLMDWYLARTPNEQASSVHPFVTKGGLSGISAGDRLETMFAWGSKVFTFHYILGGQPFINYRTTFEMMLNSLKLVGVPTISAPKDTMTGPGSLTTGIEAASSTAGVVFTPVTTSTADGFAAPVSSGVASSATSSTSSVTP